MRSKQAAMILALSALVSAAAVPASVYAEETPAEETAVEETVENTADPTKITVSVDGRDIVIENDTETIFTKAEVIVETADMDVEAGDEVTELPPIYNLALETEEGVLHFFSGIDPLAWNEPVLVEEFGIYYVQFHDAEGEGEEVEDIEEKDLPEPVTVHTTADANIRKAPSLDGEKIRTTSPGEEFTAVGAAPGWVHVKSEKEEGYIAHQYLTYEKAVAAEQPPVQPEAVPDTPAPTAPSTSETKTEVSRTAYDDNDGSGHGYWEILYSDGSVAYAKY